MNLNQIEEARALATPVGQIQTADNTSPWAVVQYVPSLGTGGTAATVTVAAGADTLTLLVGAAVPAGLDAIGNTSGEILLSSSSYDTAGELADYVNSVACWRMYLVGALRADKTSNLNALSATSCIGVNGVKLYGDTSDSAEVVTAISGEKFVNNGKNGHVTDADDECENSLLYGAFTMGDGTGAIVLKIYSEAQGSTGVQMGGDIATTEDTLKELGETDWDEPFITAKRGERLVIKAVSDSAFDAVAFQVVGKTAVFRGDRIVTEVNF